MKALLRKCSPQVKIRGINDQSAEATLHRDYPATIQDSRTSKSGTKNRWLCREIYVDEGSAVRKGQPRLRLVPSVRAGSENREANIKSAEADVNDAMMQV